MRDYRLSLTLIALVMLGYTAVVLINKKSSDGRSSASVQQNAKQPAAVFESASAPVTPAEKD
jgi:hypothetical protein